MYHFFLATLISYVVYWISRGSLSLYLYLRDIREDQKVSGFFPNLFAVGIIVGWGCFYIHLTIFLTLVVKELLF